MKSSYWQRCSD